MRVLLPVLLVALVWFPRPVVHAQVPAERARASTVLDIMGIDHILAGEIGQGRGRFLSYQRQFGLNEEEADKVYVQYVLKELMARRPQLHAWMEDVVLHELTPAELRSVADDRQDEAWHTAQTKARTLKTDLGRTFVAWRNKATGDVFARDAAALNKLGAHRPPPDTME